MLLTGTQPCTFPTSEIMTTKCWVNSSPCTIFQVYLGTCLLQPSNNSPFTLRCLCLIILRFHFKEFLITQNTLIGFRCVYRRVMKHIFLCVCGHSLIKIFCLLQFQTHDQKISKRDTVFRNTRTRSENFLSEAPGAQEPRADLGRVTFD